MSTVLAVANQKGGVGKTTTSVNLSASLASTKRRVLMIDLDPQGNATMGSGIDKHRVAQSSAEILMGTASIEEAMISVEQSGYTLLPGNIGLTVTEVELMAAEAREYRLKQVIQTIRSHFDYIIIDCPPALNTLTVNALVAAEGVIIPIQCEYYALEGLSALLHTIERIRDQANPGLRITGLLRTMYDSRNNLANDVSSQLTSHFGDQVFRTIIPRNVTLAEAPSHGLPILYYERNSRGSLAYLALAGEILRRESTPDRKMPPMSTNETSLTPSKTPA
jgi:chromosome partitioning protein